MISLNEHLSPALSPSASDADAEREGARTLAMVRELSENATLRPAPRKLFCRPLRAYVVPPAPPAWKFNRDLLLSSLVTRLSSLA